MLAIRALSNPKPPWHQQLSTLIMPNFAINLSPTGMRFMNLECRFGIHLNISMLLTTFMIGQVHHMQHVTAHCEDQYVVDAVDHH